jgi:hypothetical protein
MLSTGSGRCNSFYHRHTEAYNKPAPRPPPCMYTTRIQVNPKTHAPETTKRVKTSLDANPYPPTQPSLGRPPVH